MGLWNAESRSGKDRVGDFRYLEFDVHIRVQDFRICQAHGHRMVWAKTSNGPPNSQP